MTDNTLCYLSATEALRRFRDGSLSPVELMTAVIERAEAVEPQVNAFTLSDFDSALKQAQAAEARYQRGNPRPLEGIPLAVKDSSDIAGMPTSRGSIIYKDEVAETTSFANQRLLDAGAIVHARTTTPEFSCAVVCHSRLWGVTRNPWNLDFTPGGSSGGAGASLAAGTTTLATGSDIGGSIRVPASCCGVVGYKPPYGRNPQNPPFNLDPYCHVGPLTRTVADAQLLQNLMAGPHPADIASLPAREPIQAKLGPLSGLRIAASLDLGFYPLDSQVRANTEAVLQILRELGAQVEQVQFNWNVGVEEAAIAHLSHLFGNSIAPLLDSHEHLMTDYAIAFARAGQASTVQGYLAARETAGQMYHHFGTLMQKFDAFICPTTAVAAVAATFNPAQDSLSIGGRPVHPFLGWVMTPAFNILSRCPVLALPSGYTEEGVPTGVQVVGRVYDDDTVFQVGLALEERCGLWRVGARLPVLS